MSIFWPNISQLKCSAGRRDVMEIKRNIFLKIRDKTGEETGHSVKTNTWKVQNNKSKGSISPLNFTIYFISLHDG